MRAELGPVVILNPWNDELKNDPSFGLDLGDDGFNPLQNVDVTKAGLDEAGTLAEMLLPIRKDEDGYFAPEGRSLLEWGLIWLAATQPRSRVNLSNLRALLMDGKGMEKAFRLIAKTERQEPGWPTLREGARKYVGLLDTDAGGQYSGIVGTATNALKIYGSEKTLADHTSRNGFKLSDLKGEKPITVFVICPPNHLVSDDRAWLNMTLRLICLQIGKPGFARETVLLMDEFPALGHLPNLMPSLEQFREAGLRAHLIAQNPGQILNIYDKDGLARLWGCCDVKQFFRFTDYQHARDVSAWTGEYTAKTTTTNAKGEISESLVGIPLIRPDELVGMPADGQIVLRPAMPPIKAKIFPYFKRSAWRSLVAPNPYRNKKR